MENPISQTSSDPYVKDFPKGELESLPSLEPPDENSIAHPCHQPRRLRSSQVDATSHDQDNEISQTRKDPTVAIPNCDSQKVRKY